MKANGKYALITGATSGIGYELAKLFAQDGYNLIIVSRGENGDLEKTASELTDQYGIEVTTMAKDLFQRENAFAVYDEVKAKGIEIDVLVNDAGQGQYGLFTETDINRELGHCATEHRKPHHSYQEIFAGYGCPRRRQNFKSFFYCQQTAGTMAISISRHQGICAIFYRGYTQRKQRHRRYHHGIAARCYRYRFF